MHSDTFKKVNAVTGNHASGGNGCIMLYFTSVEPEEFRREVICQNGRVEMCYKHFLASSPILM